MWIGQKAYVKNEVGVLGNSLTKSEAHAGHQNAFLRRLFLKTLGDVSAKLVNVELRSVDDEIGHRPNGAQVTAFRFQRRFYGRVGAQGMRPARLAETTHQHRVGGFQEDYLGRNQAPDRLQDLRKIFQLRALTDATTRAVRRISLD